MTAEPSAVSAALIDQICELGAVKRAVVRPDSRLLEDLDLDSLALVELIVWAAEEFDLKVLADDLETRRWEGTTVSEVVSRIERELDSK